MQTTLIRKLTETGQARKELDQQTRLVFSISFLLHSTYPEKSTISQPNMAAIMAQPLSLDQADSSFTSENNQVPEMQQWRDLA